MEEERRLGELGKLATRCRSLGGGERHAQQPTHVPHLAAEQDARRTLRVCIEPRIERSDGGIVAAACALRLGRRERRGYLAVKLLGARSARFQHLERVRGTPRGACGTHGGDGGGRRPPVVAHTRERVKHVGGRRREGPKQRAAHRRVARRCTGACRRHAHVHLSLIHISEPTRPY